MTTVKPTVNRITIYPVKSLDGISLQKAQIASGCLLHDREYAIHGSNGKYINGKSNALVHLLRSRINFEEQVLSLRHELETGWNDFHLVEQKEDINEYLSAFFKEPAILSRNTEGKFMDIPGIAGMTVLSEESLVTVSSWFDDLDMEEVRKRFRATIEISGVPAFWEDHLFTGGENVIEFKISDATVLGVSPRARCVVPTRHPQTGEIIHGFPKSFAKHRASSLPEWSALDNYEHSYYLTVNCFIPPSEFKKTIGIGDIVRITGKRAFP